MSWVVLPATQSTVTVKDGCKQQPGIGVWHSRRGVLQE